MNSFASSVTYGFQGKSGASGVSGAVGVSGVQGFISDKYLEKFGLRLKNIFNHNGVKTYSVYDKDNNNTILDQKRYDYIKNIYLRKDKLNKINKING
jgi:hypothetical protein